jgi:hypothetical protein
MLATTNRQRPFDDIRQGYYPARMESELTISGRRPSSDEMLDALLVAARTLGIWTCYHHQGSFHFALGSGYSIALSSESAGRIRVETCRLCLPVSRMWVRADAHERLAGLVARMASEVPELV